MNNTIMQYTDDILEVMEADMDYGDKTGCIMAIVQKIIDDKG